MATLSSKKSTTPFIAFLERLLSLLVVLLLVASTAVATGRLLGHDFAAADTPAAPARTGTDLPADKLKELIPEGAHTVRRDSAVWEVFNDSEQLVGHVVNSAPLARDITGFAGPTPIYMYVDTEGTVTGIAAADNLETPDFFRRAAGKILHAWDGRKADGAAEPDAVSGATYTSVSLIRNMQAARNAFLSLPERAAAAPAIGWGRTAALTAVLLAGMLAAWRFRGKRFIRVTVLLLNVGVTGFWCGQTLSFSLFHHSMQNGLNLTTALPAVLLLAVAATAALTGRKGYFCQWVCPYGSLQELAGHLPFPKITVGPRTFRFMSRLRLGALLALLAVLWTGTGAMLLDYEPFAAFQPAQAGAAVLVPAALFVVAGCFLPRPWCRCLCPVGEILKLTEN